MRADIKKTILTNIVIAIERIGKQDYDTAIYRLSVAIDITRKLKVKALEDERLREEGEDNGSNHTH